MNMEIFDEENIGFYEEEAYEDEFFEEDITLEELVRNNSGLKDFELVEVDEYGLENEDEKDEGVVRSNNDKNEIYQQIEEEDEQEEVAQDESTSKDKLAEIYHELERQEKKKNQAEDEEDEEDEVKISYTKRELEGTTTIKNIKNPPDISKLYEQKFEIHKSSLWSWTVKDRKQYCVLVDRKLDKNETALNWITRINVSKFIGLIPYVFTKYYSIPSYKLANALFYKTEIKIGKNKTIEIYDPNHTSYWEAYQEALSSLCDCIRRFVKPYQNKPFAQYAISYIRNGISKGFKEANRKPIDDLMSSEDEFRVKKYDEAFQMLKNRGFKKPTDEQVVDFVRKETAMKIQNEGKKPTEQLIDKRTHQFNKKNLEKSLTARNAAQQSTYIDEGGQIISSEPQTTTRPNSIVSEIYQQEVFKMQLKCIVALACLTNNMVAEYQNYDVWTAKYKYNHLSIALGPHKTQAKIADKLKISQQAVNKNINTLRKTLRKQILKIIAGYATKHAGSADELIGKLIKKYGKNAVNKEIIEEINTDLNAEFNLENLDEIKQLHCLLRWGGLQLLTK